MDGSGTYGGWLLPRMCHAKKSSNTFHLETIDRLYFQGKVRKTSHPDFKADMPVLGKTSSQALHYHSLPSASSVTHKGGTEAGNELKRKVLPTCHCGSPRWWWAGQDVHLKPLEGQVLGPGPTGATHHCVLRPPGLCSQSALCFLHTSQPQEWAQSDAE